jgi:VanZ family protein
MKGIFKRVIYTWLPVIVWAGVIFAFSSQPTGQVSHVDWQDFVVKKTAHLVVYGIFTILLFRAFRLYKINIGNSVVLAVLISTIYGASDEFHQSFTPGREPRFRDVAIDAVGSVITIYLLLNVLPKAPKKVGELAKKLDFI